MILINQRECGLAGIWKGPKFHFLQNLAYEKKNKQQVQITKYYNDKISNKIQECYIFIFGLETVKSTYALNCPKLLIVAQLSPTMK